MGINKIIQLPSTSTLAEIKKLALQLAKQAGVGIKLEINALSNDTQQSVTVKLTSEIE